MQFFSLLKVVVFKYHNSVKELESMDDILPLMILVLSRLPTKTRINSFVSYFEEFVNSVSDRDFSFEEKYLFHFKVLIGNIACCFR